MCLHRIKVEDDEELKTVKQKERGGGKVDAERLTQSRGRLQICCGRWQTGAGRERVRVRSH